jgi:hypothetical protein
MPRKPEPKFVVTYSNEPLDLPEEEMKRRYESFIKMLVAAYKASVEEEAKL